MRLLHLIALSLVVGIVSECPAQDVRIMPIGDSITEAYKGASYRYFLRHQLLASGRCVDFVGTQSGTYRGSGKYPDFDRDHEGHWGYRADQLAANAYQWAATYQPDIVLCHAGSVDTFYGQSTSSTIDDIGLIIDEVRRANPNVAVFVAQVISFGTKFNSYNASLNSLNAALPALVASKTTAGSPVTLVDHNTGWNPAIHSYDHVHPNEVGEQLMATTWHTAIAPSIPLCPPRLRIMPLGDSITQAKRGHASYRYFLWHTLSVGGIEADFVGSMHGVDSGKPKYENFDQDHEAHNGYRADELAANAYDWAVAAQPDVVLCHTGSVDVFSGQSTASTIADIGNIIDELRRANPAVRILVAQVTSFGSAFNSYNTGLAELNAAIPALVASKSTAQSPVSVADHHSAWIPSIHCYDGVHPSQTGEQQMASTWYRAMYPPNLDNPNIGSRSSIKQFGVTWTLDQEYTTGQFANGDWWVVGPVTINQIDPPSVTGARVMNGSMINPSATDIQAYDSAMGNNSYNAAGNVALNVSPLNPLTVQPASSLVSTVSHVTPGLRPQLTDCAILTVLAQPAAGGDFRPSYSGSDKTIKFNMSQLDTSLLKQLAPTNNTPALTVAERMFQRPWLDHVGAWVGRECHPSNNMPAYGRDMARDISVGALMLHLDFSTESKLPLLVRYVQVGIDLTGVALNGGQTNWVAAGGHASGRKWPILFAGLMLNDAEMKNIDSNSIAFGEDQQTWFVTQADVGRALTPNPKAATVLYTQEDVGTAEWGIEHATRPERDNANWAATYRQCCTANAWNGFVLAARIMNAKQLWNHDALFDYQDRYIATCRDLGLAGWIVSWDNFTIEMWDAYRSSY